MRCLVENKIEDSDAYVYHGSTTRQSCESCGAKESIYKDTKGNAFCIKCLKDVKILD